MDSNFFQNVMVMIWYLGYKKVEKLSFESELFMLITIDAYKDIDAKKLMDIYSESNYENTDYFCPDEVDKTVAVKMVEDRFLDYLQNEFWAREGASYWVLEKDGVWISACRISKIQSGLYYLEALETRPDYRGNGYASLLLSEIVESLKKTGAFRICDCVGKKNIASLRTHEKAGFMIMSEEGYDYLQNESEPQQFGLEYRFYEE